MTENIRIEHNVSEQCKKALCPSPAWQIDYVKFSTFLQMQINRQTNKNEDELNKKRNIATYIPIPVFFNA